MALAVREERYERLLDYGRESRHEERKHGKAAVGLNWEARRRHLERAGEPVQEQQAAGTQKRKTAVQRRILAKEKRQAVVARFRMPLLGLLGTALAAVLAVMALMGYIELTRLSSETVSLKNQLKTLQTENISLNAEYERMFDLASVKEAAEAVGMSKPGSSQISYLNLAEGDRAVVYRQEENGVLAHILLSARGSFEALKEFFG